jgi:exopolyphosphatase/guanosine-5'-triphosphate,3'-diphosphate pyrophosphatase
MLPGESSTSTSPPVEGERRMAVIDIGSNAVRLLVADVGPKGQLRRVARDRVEPRLASGLLAGGVLDATAMEGAVAAIAEMVGRAYVAGAASVDIVATSAVREARNGRAFVDWVVRATGLPVRVLSERAEAELAFEAASSYFDLSTGRFLVCDIGGGSVQVALVENARLHSVASFPLGAIRVTEEFPEMDRSPEQLAEVRRCVRERLLARSPGLREWRGARMLGIGGTFTSLAAVHLASAGQHEGSTVHGVRMDRSQLESILEVLASTPLEERRRIPGLEAGRADIIVGGTAVAAELLAIVNGPEVVVSAYGIREAVLLERAAHR